MSAWGRFKSRVVLYFARFRRLFQTSKQLPEAPPSGAFVDMIVTSYLEAGASFGDAVSMIYMGECIGFEKLLEEWEKWEAEYLALGFRSLSIDDFVGIGGWGKDPEALGLRQMRLEGEKPIFHARYYRRTYLGKLGRHPAIDAAFKGEVSSGEYFVPTTDHLKKRA